MSTIERIAPSGGDYTTPQAWYDAHAGTITADPGAPYIGEIEAGVYPALNMTASVTDNDHYFHLRAVSGDEFRARLDDPVGGYGGGPHSYPKIAGIRCFDDYFRLEHVAVHDVYPAHQSGFYGFGDHLLVDSCGAQDLTDAGNVYGWYMLGTNCTLRNVVAARLESTGATAVGLWLSNSASHCYQSCVHLVVASTDGYGIILEAATTLYNTAIGTITGGSSATSVLANSGTPDADYNAVTDATPGDAGPNSQTSIVPATEWEQAGATGTDFHLAAGAAKLPDNAGSWEDAYDAPTTDIDDEPIGDEIGVDTVGSVGSATELGAWYRPLDEPILPAEPLVAEGQQFFQGEPTEWPAAETITVDKWAQPLAEPTLPPPPAPTGEQFFQPEPSLWPTPETLTLDKWFRPLDTPQFPDPPSPEGFAELPVEDVVTPLPFLGDWWMPLSEPVWADPTPLEPLPELIITPSILLGRFYHDGRGQYRVFNAAEYRFYRSQSGPPQPGDTPWATASSLPDTPTDTFADGVWYIACSYFSGVLDSGLLAIGPRGETYIRLELSGGQEQGTPPPGPTDWQLQADAGGVVRVVGWVAAAGGIAPTQWAIAYTTDGSTPAADSPDVTVAMDSATYLHYLNYALPAQADGTTVKVRLQTRRQDSGWIYSSGSTVKSLAADAAGPAAPETLAAWPGLIPPEV